MFAFLWQVPCESCSTFSCFKVQLLLFLACLYPIHTCDLASGFHRGPSLLLSLLFSEKGELQLEFMTYICCVTSHKASQFLLNLIPHIALVDKRPVKRATRAKPSAVRWPHNSSWKPRVIKTQLSFVFAQ